MNARLMATCTIFALALGGFALSTQISAQSSGSASRGLLATLKVGQMVRYNVDQWGNAEILTYEDDSLRHLMLHKVREIGHDFLSIEFDDRNVSGAVSETRLSIHHISQVAHVGKSRQNAGTATADDPLSDKPTKAGGKTTTTKKKN